MKIIVLVKMTRCNKYCIKEQAGINASADVKSIFFMKVFSIHVANFNLRPPAADKKLKEKITSSSLGTTILN